MNLTICATGGPLTTEDGMFIRRAVGHIQHRERLRRRRLRVARQARSLYLVPTRLPVLRQSRLAWYRALAELILGLLAVLAAAVIVGRMVPWT